MSGITWPERPTCHDDAIQAPRFADSELNVGWRPAEPQGRPYGRDEAAGWLGPYGKPFRTCWYCGSMHPEDLYAILSGAPRPKPYLARLEDALEPGEPLTAGNYEDVYRRWINANAARGIRLAGADWKYGWPHKFYVEGIPNPIAGQEVCLGGRYAGGTFEPELGPAPPYTHAKFYNEHLLDLGPGAFVALAPLIERFGGVRFIRTADGLKYRAPHRGYQRSGG